MTDQTMSTYTASTYTAWVNRTAIDSSGNKLGTISDGHVDNDTSVPSWLAVRTGPSRTKVSFVPIEGASAAGADATVRWGSGLDTDDTMTRSEEELRGAPSAATRAQPGCARGVETENVTVTVPVEREKARLVTEPITDGDRHAAHGRR